MENAINLSEQELNELKYPTGKLTWESEYTDEVIDGLIRHIEAFPIMLNEVAQSLKESDLVYSYRPGGWNIRQIIHHLADSHSNGFIRNKLALTENNPTIKPYDENAFAALPDTAKMPIDASVFVINGIHARWSYLLRSMKAEEFKRTYFHPENQKTWAISSLLSIYAWHGKHHVGQIKVAMERKF
ncbi:MAG: YfiT family bacillithiol transferase [Bacteroidia bacterium]